MTIFKILLFGIAASMLAVMIGDGKEISRILTISAALSILSFVLLQSKDALGFMRRLQEQTGIGEQYIGIVFKVIAICIAGEFASSICTDHRDQTLKTALDVACKCTVIVLAIPIFSEVLECIGDLLK